MRLAALTDMKKITKKLALSRQTVRVLSGAELDAVAGGGGHANPTTTVFRHSVDPAAAAGCRHHATTVVTAMCVRPPAATGE